MHLWIILAVFTIFLVPKVSPEYVECSLEQWESFLSQFKCDGIQHCSDNSDEKDCHSCTNSHHCETDRKCIAKKKVCDNAVDCSDGSDERNCTAKPAVEMVEVSSSMCLSAVTTVLYVVIKMIN